MDTTAHASRSALELSWTTPESASIAREKSPNDADAVRRSEDNILRWMKYLPDDCINRMIEMGWDVST